MEKQTTQIENTTKMGKRLQDCDQNFEYYEKLQEQISLRTEETLRNWEEMNEYEDEYYSQYSDQSQDISFIDELQPEDIKLYDEILRINRNENLQAQKEIEQKKIDENELRIKQRAIAKLRCFIQQYLIESSRKDLKLLFQQYNSLYSFQSLSNTAVILKMLSAKKEDLVDEYIKEIMNMFEQDE